jgi:protocatechuate 3,4-dioxygenase beta subunit
MSRSYRVFGILLLVVASLLVAASPAAASTGAIGKDFTLPAVTRTTYSISGTVRVNSTSAAVSGVEVSAASTSASGPFTYGSALTKASGLYTISSLLPGSYTLRFDPPRTTNLQHGYRTATAPTYFSAKTPVVVTITTASLTGKDIRLLHGFEISGKATRSNGTTAIPMLPVNADGASGSDGTTTDSAGNYTLMGLSPGSYEVSFGHDPTASNQTGCWYSAVASKFSATCVSHTAVAISAANVTGISPKIPNGLEITGYLKTRDASPLPVADAAVFANGPEHEWAYSDATGKYTITGLNPGSYQILANGPYNTRFVSGYYNATGPYFWGRLTAWASPVTISSAITTLPIIKPPSGYFIKGKITNISGTGLSSVFVESLGGAGSPYENPGNFTDSSGNYSIGPLSANQSYKIHAITTYSSDPSVMPGWYLSSPPNNFTAAASSALSLLMTGDKNAINMRLPVGAAISGTVTITGGGACGNCTVYAFDATGVQVEQTSTTLSGAYTLSGLPAGSYRVEAWSMDPAIDATHVRIITEGFYKSGAAPHFSATLAGATAIAVTP